MKLLITGIIGIIVVLLGVIFIMRQSRQEIKVGGLYSARASEKGWGIIKVLAHEGTTTNVRIYSNKFTDRPIDVNPTDLFMAAMDDPIGYLPGIGHLPVTDDVFYSWEPRLIRVTEVMEEELKGVKEFKKAGGRPFDTKFFKK